MDYKLLYLHGNKPNWKKQTPKKAANKNKKGYNQLPDCSINLKHLKNSGMFTGTDDTFDGGNSSN